MEVMEVQAAMKSEKFQLLIEKEAIDAIDEWSFANRVRSRAEAVRRLVSLGLQSKDASKEKADAQRA
jgi:metal-responsive CopG/Arc/MetJ family transcriptional regulator